MTTAMMESDPMARLRTVADRLCPIAAPATVLPPYYLEDATGYTDGADYCLPCARAALAAIAHGEYGLYGYVLRRDWSGESDSPRHCETCGVILDYTLSDYGATEELSFFETEPPTALDPATAYSLLQLCDAYAYGPMDSLPPALLALLDVVEGLC